MHFQLKDGNRLYYEITGNQNARKCLVFLNGLSQSTIAWAGIAPAFEKDYKIVLLDLVFQGKSDKNSDVRDFDQHATDVQELLVFLNNEEYILIGISYGSLVAQHLMFLFPDLVSRAVLMSTFAHKTPYFDAIETSWNHALDMGGYQLLLDVMLPQVLGQSYFDRPIIPIDQLKEARKGAAPDPVSLKKLMTATKQRADFRPKLKFIDTPTLVIHGQADLLIPIPMGKAVADNILGSTFSIVPNAGHTLNLEAIPESVKLIQDFLNSGK